MTMTTTEGLAYLTEGEPGTGGKLKSRPEDFMVEEIPLFEPSGTGDHLYVYVEKHRRLTTDVVRFFSKHFQVPRTAIGYAGLKDKHAITRQWFSIEHATEDRAWTFDDENVRILDVERHDSKLKRGNLQGNRFFIRIREVEPAHVVRAKRILDLLVEKGAPNFIGAQRFGYRRDNQLQGKHLLLGEPRAMLDHLLGKPQADEPQLNREARAAYDAGEYSRALELWPTVHRFERQALGALSRGASPDHAVNAIDKPHRGLLISAFQSAIFNELLDERLRAGTLDQLQLGDLAFKHDTRGVFEVRDVEREQPRCDRLAISPTGPMWGRKMTRAGGEIGQRELEALERTGVHPEQLGEGEFTTDGSRRAMRMPIGEPDVRSGVDDHGAYIAVRFELPRGCFATVALRELMKDGRA